MLEIHFYMFSETSNKHSELGTKTSQFRMKHIFNTTISSKFPKGFQFFSFSTMFRNIPVNLTVLNQDS